MASGDTDSFDWVETRPYYMPENNPLLPKPVPTGDPRRDAEAEYQYLRSLAFNNAPGQDPQRLSDLEWWLAGTGTKKGGVGSQLADAAGGFMGTPAGWLGAGMLGAYGLGIGGEAAAAGAELGSGELASLAGGAGLGDTATLGGGFMTPAGAAVEPLGGAAWQASLGTPLATGGAALPGWAAGAGAAGAALPAVTGSAAGAAAPVAAGSALSRIIDGTASNSDWVQVLGTAGAGALGAYGAGRTGDRLADLQAEMRADRAPFLQAGTNYLDPQQWINGPGQAFTKGTLQQLSATHGNPISSPTALGIATDASMRNWLGGVNTLGSLGLGGQGIQAQLGSQSAGAYGDIFGNIAGAASDILNPRRSLSDLMREYRGVIA